MPLKLNHASACSVCVLFLMAYLVYVLVFIFNFKKKIFVSRQPFVPLDLYVYIEASTNKKSGTKAVMIPNQDKVVNTKDGTEIKIDIIGDGLCWFVTGMQMLSSLDTLRHIIVQAKYRLQNENHKSMLFIHYFVEFFDLYYANELILKQDISELYRNIFLTLGFGYLDLIQNNKPGDMSLFLSHLLERLEIEMPGQIYPIFFPEYSFVSEVYSTGNELLYVKEVFRDNIKFLLWNVRSFMITIRESIVQKDQNEQYALGNFKQHLQKLLTGKQTNKLTTVLCFELNIAYHRKNDVTYNIEEIKELEIAPTKKIYKLKSYAIRTDNHVYACNLEEDGKFYNMDFEIFDLNDSIKIEECDLNKETHLNDIVFLFEES